jgi:hypothetical protein
MDPDHWFCFPDPDPHSNECGSETEALQREQFLVPNEYGSSYMVRTETFHKITTGRTLKKSRMHAKKNKRNTNRWEKICDRYTDIVIVEQFYRIGASSYYQIVPVGNPYVWIRKK